METIKRNSCIKIGRIVKPFSISGEMILHLEDNIDECVANASVFFVEIDNLLVPFFPVPDAFYFKTDNTAIISFDDISSKGKAHELDNQLVFIDKKEYFTREQPNETASIEGFTVTDIQWGEIGTVSEINDYNGNTILSIQNNNHEILIPLTDELIVNIDENKRNLIIRCDKSLLSLNEK